MPSCVLQSKWQDYLFLTVEMKKFLLRSNLEMFFSLLDQREAVQNEILQQDDTSYNTSTEGKQFLQKIKAVNEDMCNCFHRIFNGMKNRENVMQQYESKVIYAGNYFNKRT